MTRSPTPALIPPIMLGIAYLLVLVPIDAWSLYRFGNAPVWPIRVLAYAVVLASVVICWRLSGMRLWSLPRYVRAPRVFNDWGPGSCSLALPGIEVGLHYPPSWARPLRYVAAIVGFFTLLCWAAVLAYIARTLAP